MMQLPAAHNLAHRLGRFVANRRRETDEQIASAIHRLPGSKRKSKKIESLLWMTVQPVRILAVNNLRLLRANAIPVCTSQAGLPALVATNALALHCDSD